MNYKINELYNEEVMCSKKKFNKYISGIAGILGSLILLGNVSASDLNKYNKNVYEEKPKAVEVARKNCRKPYLGGLARIDEEGWIYPDRVDKDQSGKYKYDRSNIEETLLAFVEAINKRDEKLYRELTKGEPFWKNSLKFEYGPERPTKVIYEIYKIRKYRIIDIIDMGNLWCEKKEDLKKRHSKGVNIEAIVDTIEMYLSPRTSTVLKRYYRRIGMLLIEENDKFYVYWFFTSI